MSKDSAKREAEWRGEDDHRTLQRAAEVRRDPARMKGVEAHHRKTMAQIGDVGRELKRRQPKRSAKRSMSSGR